MRRAGVVLLAAALGSATAAPLGARQVNDVLQAFGLSEAAANDSILNSFTTGSLVVAGARAVFTAATPEKRAAFVRGAIAVARAYAATDDFAKRYASLRASQRPEREPLPQNGDEALAAQMKQLEAVAKEALKLAENMPPQAREDLIENIEFTKRQLAELNKDPKHRASVDAAAREAAKVADEEYQQAMARYEAEFPAEVRELVARRLHAFLLMSETVDFSAKTIVGTDKKHHFASPTYESMPREWKMLYRAGKPAVDAARAAAADWLKALEGK